jgi:hypothetical protein
MTTFDHASGVILSRDLTKMVVDRLAEVGGMVWVEVESKPAPLKNTRVRHPRIRLSVRRRSFDPGVVMVTARLRWRPYRSPED